MSVDIDATTDLLLLIQQKLRIVQYQYGSLPPTPLPPQLKATDIHYTL